MKMDNAIIDIDEIELVMEELLKQNVTSNHKALHWFDCFFWIQKYAHQKRSIFKHLIVVTLKTTRFKDIQSPCTTKAKAKSLIETKNETTHTKENETTTPVQKNIGTPLLGSWPKTPVIINVTFWRSKLKSPLLEAILIVNCPV